MTLISESNVAHRVLQISHKHKLSHLGSCLSAIEPLIEIFSRINLDYDKFVLSAGHAGLSYYVILEMLGYGDAELMLEKAGIHPDRSINNHLAFAGHGKRDPINCSTGSLGQGLPIALGMAIADPETDVYCLISDGECAEGSIWESLRIKHELQVKNLHIYVNVNGYGAYSRIDEDYLTENLEKFDEDILIFYTGVYDIPFLETGWNAHYHVMNDEQYKQALSILGVEYETVG